MAHAVYWVNITTAPGCLKMSEFNEIMRIVNQNAHPEVECKFGAAEDESMSEDAIRITIIATGLKENGTDKPTARCCPYPTIGTRCGRSASSSKPKQC